MTPYELYIEDQAFELRMKRENSVNINLLNAVSKFFGGETITFDELLNYKTLKDYKLKNINDFRENGKINLEKWEKYREEVIKPAKRELGLEV